jgi:hypothetical protein
MAPTRGRRELGRELWLWWELGLWRELRLELGRELWLELRLELGRELWLELRLELGRELRPRRSKVNCHFQSELERYSVN